MREFLPSAKRDAAVMAVTAGLWWLDRRLRGEGRGASAIGVAAGAATGLSAFLLHEWGHLAGAVLSGGVAQPDRRATSPFLFNFDIGRSTRGQFVAMSVGGFAATALATAAITRRVPREALSGKVALAATVGGLIATAALELPPFFRVLAGGPMPRGVAYVDGSDEKK